MMEMNDYQDIAIETRLESAESYTYLALGLCGEAGEVAEKVKKYIRDGELDREAVVRELGDVLWYLANLAERMGCTLNGVAAMNLDKLRDRKERGKLQGSGDDR